MTMTTLAWLGTAAWLTLAFPIYMLIINRGRIFSGTHVPDLRV
jgi:hypothetical protein